MSELEKKISKLLQEEQPITESEAQDLAAMICNLPEIKGGRVGAEVSDDFGGHDNPHARMRDIDLQFDEVIINGKKYEPNMMHLSYEWIVEQAFNNDREDYTVTFFYKKKPGAFNTKQGTLMAGDYLNCEDGLIINVADTNKA